MFQGCSGVVPGCSGVFRGCSGDVPGCSGGVPGCSGVFRGVPGVFRVLQTPQKPPTRFVIETFQLITLAVCCGYVSNLIGRRTINIPEIILGVHGMAFLYRIGKIPSQCKLTNILSILYVHKKIAWRLIFVG